MRFRKKPVEVDAVQWFKDGDHPEVHRARIGPFQGHDLVTGKQGVVKVDPGDWIIAEMDGSGHYPCKPDVFAATYVAAERAGMTFGEALERLKAGARIARHGWNGKGMWLSLSGPLEGREIPAASFWSDNNREYAIARAGSANVLPCITMKTADGSILMGWLASQTDMLAEDWAVAA